MSTTTRTRVVEPPRGSGKGTQWGLRFGSSYSQGGSITTDLSGIQTTVSEGHPFRSKRSSSRRPEGDVGGPFSTTKSYIASGIDHISAHVGVSGAGPNAFAAYSGPTMVCIPSFAGKIQFPPNNVISESALDAIGAEAIARCKPTNSVADVSTFLGETLKDGIPSIMGSQLWKDRTDLARKAGSEYLNYQFGWRPLVNDVTKFANGVKNASAVLAQYERDAGKVVRRRYNFPLSITTEEIDFGADFQHQLMFPFNTDFSLGNGRKAKRTREIVHSRWFSGAFTYYLPSGYDSRNAMDRYALLADRLGVSLTPQTLWNLAPWSWAIDWFSNTGDVLSNVSDFITGGLIMRYGYMMDHTIVKDTYTQGVSGLHPSVPLAKPLVIVTETKIRRQANPFGFGVQWNALSTFQTSILAALGLTKGRR